MANKSAPGAYDDTPSPSYFDNEPASYQQHQQYSQQRGGATAQRSNFAATSGGGGGGAPTGYVGPRHRGDLYYDYGASFYLDTVWILNIVMSL
jgi:hypothetical protein